VSTGAYARPPLVNTPGGLAEISSRYLRDA
jgi:hypothetical protein